MRCLFGKRDVTHPGRSSSAPRPLVGARAARSSERESIRAVTSTAAFPAALSMPSVTTALRTHLRVGRVLFAGGSHAGNAHQAAHGRRRETTVNSVQLIGNLTRDPERRTTSGDTSVVGLRLAVDGRRRNKAGDWVRKPGYFDVTVFGQLADVAMEYLAKGRKVAVSGRLDFQQWKADDGSTRSKVEVIASEVEFLTPAKRGDDDTPGADLSAVPEASADGSTSTPEAAAA